MLGLIPHELIMAPHTRATAWRVSCVTGGLLPLVGVFAHGVALKFSFTPLFALDLLYSRASCEIQFKLLSK